MLAFSPGQNRFSLRSPQVAHFAIDGLLQFIQFTHTLLMKFINSPMFVHIFSKPRTILFIQKILTANKGAKLFVGIFKNYSYHITLHLSLLKQSNPTLLSLNSCQEIYQPFGLTGNRRNQQNRSCLIATPTSSILAFLHVLAITNEFKQSSTVTVKDKDLIPIHSQLFYG